MLGRWSQDQFTAILDIDAASAMTISGEVARKLSGNYSVRENGQTRRLTLQATAGVADPVAARDAATFHKKLAQLAAALAGA